MSRRRHLERIDRAALGVGDIYMAKCQPSQSLYTGQTIVHGSTSK